MKTSVELDEKKVKLARKLADASTLRELLDQALDALIAQNRRKSMINLLGSDFFVGNLNKRFKNHFSKMSRTLTHLT